MSVKQGDWPQVTPNLCDGERSFFAFFGVLGSDCTKVTLIRRKEEKGWRPIFENSHGAEKDENVIFELLNWQQYFSWDVFQEAIKGQQMPIAWQNLPSTRGLRPPFTDFGSPVIHTEPLSLDDLFADKCLKIRSATIAHTPFDMGPRWPSNIKTIWDHTNEYEIPVKKMRKALDWMVEKFDSESERFPGLLRNGTVVRLRSYEDDGEGHLLLDLHKTYYFNTICTNEMVQHNARLKDSGEAVIDLLLPKEEDGQRHLGVLDNALSNHAGITAIILTRDGFPLMFHRSGKQHMNPDTIGFVTSSVWAWEPNLEEPHQYLINRSLRETGMNWNELARIPESPDDNRVSSILYLGATREWSRGGKPELFYLLLSKHSLEEHIEELRKRESNDDSLRNQKVRSETIVRSSQLQLCREGYLGDASSVTLGIEKLLDMGEINGIEIEEPAKAGLYLLHNAYVCPKKAILQKFFEQHKIDFVA